MHTNILKLVSHTVTFYRHGYHVLTQRIGHWTPSSRVQTRPKPLDFSGVRKILSMPPFGGEVKESVPCPSFAACKKY